MGGKQQIDERQTNSEDHQRLPAGLFLFLRHAGPFRIITTGQYLGGDLLDSRQRLTRADTRGGLAGNHGRGKQVVTGNLARAVHTLHRHEVGVRHHIPLLILSIQAEQILRIHTILRSRLQHDLVHLAETDEVGGVEATYIGLQGLHGLVHVDA